MIFALEQQRNEIAKKTKHKNTHFKIIGRRESREKNKKIKKIKLKWKRGRNYWFFDSDWKEMIDWSKKRREEKRRERERKDSHSIKILWQWSVNIHPIHRCSLFSLVRLSIQSAAFGKGGGGRKGGLGGRGYPIQKKESQIKSGWILLNPISVQNYPGV